MNRAKLALRAAVAGLALLGASAVCVPRAQAENETWQIRSSYPYQAQIEFYSQDRRGIAWPGGGHAYDLNDSARHSFSLNCQPGERICYGAWVTGRGSRYWGVGPDNAHSCTDCCWTCGRKGAPRAINLTP